MKARVIAFDREEYKWVEVAIEEFSITLRRRENGSLEKSAIASWTSRRFPSQKQLSEAFRVGRGFFEAKKRQGSFV